MVASQRMRSGDRFLQLRSTMKKELEPHYGRRISDAELTDSIAQFMQDERLDALMVKRAKGRRGLF